MIDAPTHLDLFSGIGGFSLAFESAGFKTIGFSEIDKFANAVLKKHWPDVPNYGDVRTVPTIACDVITGGFPCQPFSFAGKRRGAADDRFLWPSMLDVIRRCQPIAVLGENVPGIIGMELDRVLDDLETCGFWTQAFVVPACAVGGNHRRDRVWVVAYSKCKGLQRCRQCGGVCGESRKTHSISSDGMFIGRRDWTKHIRHLSDGDGIPNSLARLAVKSYGNAIVPQVAQVFAKAIYNQMTFPLAFEAPNGMNLGTHNAGQAG